LSFASAISSFAIEGLHISVQCSNVVLSWPSADGETYIVQYRKTLDPSDGWQTLTSSLPAVSGTNVTSFVHSNAVQNPCNCGGSFGSMSSGQNTLASAAPMAPVPMAIPANGSGGAVPLALYPPGFDLSGFLIFDPLTGETVSGSGYTASAFALSSSQFDGPMPLDGGGASGNSSTTPEAGFYQVVRDGVYLLNSTIFNLTNGVLSNSVTVAFEAGNAANDGTGTNVSGLIDCATLIVDGNKYPGDGGVVRSPLGSFSLDTAYLENGTHSVQVEVFWFDPTPGDYSTEGLYNGRYSNPITVTVSNVIYYPQWEEEIGEGNISAYYAKTTCTNADWSIDIFDVNSNFVQRLTGHTVDGTITAYWNMVDTNGVARTNEVVDPEFSSIITVADPVTKQPPGKKRKKGWWPAHGVWTIAYQDYFRHYYSANNDMQGHINAFANTAGKYGGYWIYYPQPGQTNDVGQTYPLRYANSNHPEDGVTAQQIAKDCILLELFLSNTNSRNFFYRGHGNAQAIGYVSSSDLKKVIKHRYRFVLLQSCNSADGDLDRAFGINGPGQFAITHYQNTGIRPAAFVGNHGTSRFANWGPGSGYDGTIPWQVPYFYYNFLFYWDPALWGESLTYAIDDAIMDLPLIPGWSYAHQPGCSLQLYGYSFLLIDQYNHKPDWP
jgi:hypothetical protein